MKKNLRKFDTKIQHLKYKVRREVARYAWRDELLEKITEIPKIIVPGKESTTRCCIYKERAIINEQIKVAMGGNRQTRMSSRSSASPATSARWVDTK